MNSKLKFKDTHVDFEFGSCKSVHFAPSNYAVNFMGSIIKQTQIDFKEIMEQRQRLIKLKKF